MTRGNTRPPLPTLPRRAPILPTRFRLTLPLPSRLPITHCLLLTLVTSPRPPPPIPASVPLAIFPRLFSPVLPRHLGRLTLSLTSLLHLGRLTPSHDAQSSREAYPIHRSCPTHHACRAPPRPPPRRPSREGTCPRQPPDRAPCLPSGRIASSSDPPPHRPVGPSGLAWRPPLRVLSLTEVLFLGATEASYWTGGPAQAPSKHGSGSRDVRRSGPPRLRGCARLLGAGAVFVLVAGA